MHPAQAARGQFERMRKCHPDHDINERQHCDKCAAMNYEIEAFELFQIEDSKPKKKVKKAEAAK